MTTLRAVLATAAALLGSCGARPPTRAVPPRPPTPPGAWLVWVEERASGGSGEGGRDLRWETLWIAADGSVRDRLAGLYVPSGGRLHAIREVMRTRRGPPSTVENPEEEGPEACTSVVMGPVGGRPVEIGPGPAGPCGLVRGGTTVLATLGDVVALESWCETFAVDQGWIPVEACRHEAWLQPVGRPPQRFAGAIGADGSLRRLPEVEAALGGSANFAGLGLRVDARSQRVVGLWSSELRHEVEVPGVPGVTLPEVPPLPDAAGRALGGAVRGRAYVSQSELAGLRADWALARRVAATSTPARPRPAPVLGPCDDTDAEELEAFDLTATGRTEASGEVALAAGRFRWSVRDGVRDGIGLAIERVGQGQCAAVGLVDSWGGDGVELGSAHAVAGQGGRILLVLARGRGQYHDAEPDRYEELTWVLATDGARVWDALADGALEAGLDVTDLRVANDGQALQVRVRGERGHRRLTWAGDPGEFGRASR